MPAAKAVEPKIAEPKVSQPKIAAIESKEAAAPVSAAQSPEVKPAAPDVVQQAKTNSAHTAAPETPSPETQTAPAPQSSKSAESAQAETEEPASKPKKKMRVGDLDLDNLKLGALKLDKIVKRSASGDCKIELPFVKVRFKCED